MIAISKDHDMHRQARGVLDPFFSKAKLTEMEHRVADRVQKLCDRFRCIRGTDTVVNITNAINSLTSGKKSAPNWTERLSYAESNLRRTHHTVDY